jgi:hypothetical protein
VAILSAEKEVISLPTPVLRPVGLFATVAQNVRWSDRYGLGVRFQTTDLADLTYEGVPSGGPCTDVNTSITPRSFTDVEEQNAFSMIDAVTCSSLWKTYEQLNEDVDLHFRLMVSEALAREAMYGTGGSVHHFTADAVATNPGTASTVVGAIAELEENLATSIGNTQGAIHISPSALTYAIVNGTVNRRGELLYSPGGHLVIADAGYQLAEASTTSVIYATGPVSYAVGGQQSRAQYDWEFNDWTHNDLLALHQQFGIILYDPNKVFKITATKA